LRSARRRRQRGAAFVEAIIIISFFVLAFLALVFFRDLYLKKLLLGRVARASAIAYSMGGCTDNDPAGWAKADLGNGNNAGTGLANQQQPTRDPRPVTGSQEAQNIVSRLPGTGSDNSMLNPIGSVNLGGKVTTQSKAGGAAFKSDVTWSSHVTCGDKVRDGDFKEIVGVVTSQFKL
jgi:hypothetical protein